MVKTISSLQNPEVKQILQLQEKSRLRKKLQLFVIEGFREIELALKGKIEFQTIYILPDKFSEEALDSLGVNCAICHVTAAVYEKIAYRSSTEGIIAIAKMPLTTLEAIILPKNPLIMVAEAPEKPGNIGALLRTADAANVDAFIIANPKTDLFNPNIIRSSVGCVFTQQIAMSSTEEVIQFLKANNINILSAILQEAQAYHTQNYKEPTAIVVGTESTGLSMPWRVASTQNIKIPMGGMIDSMNVSVAAGILIFEAKRQRDFIS